MNAQRTTTAPSQYRLDGVTAARRTARKPYRIGSRVQILMLLGFAAFLDYVTGNAISAAAFYIFPVALAEWRRGARAAVLMALLSVAFSAATSWASTDYSLPVRVLMISQALHAIVYAAVAFLSTRLRYEQRLLKEQNVRIGRLNEQMAAEMHAARNLQELLSQPPPPHAGVDIATFSATARILGGDTLDIAQRGTHLAVLVGDVSGKGSPAALAAAVLAGLLDDCPTRFDSPARTLEYLNARLLNRLPPEMFVTALYLILDAATGKLLWANAGHERPFLLRAGEPGARTAEELGSDHGADLPLTLDAHSAYRDRETLLRPGDGLFCYTDGLTDLRLATGKRFGIDPLQAIVARVAEHSCAEQIDTVLREASGGPADKFAKGALEDDVTVAALRWLGNAAALTR